MKGETEASGVKGMAGILPLAVVLVGVVALTWWLLETDNGAAPWLVAAILFAHGWVHLVFLMPAGEGESAADEENPFDMSRSWLVTRGADVSQVRWVGILLAAVTFIALGLAALSVLAVLSTSWWAPLTVVGVIGSTAMLSAFFAPTLVLGFLINAGLLALVLQDAWTVTR